MRKNHNKIVCIKLVHLPYLFLRSFRASYFDIFEPTYSDEATKQLPILSENLDLGKRKTS